jgi:excisionase family DNA binding protein
MTNPFELIDARLSNIETLLLDIKHSKKEIETDQWFNLNELCEYIPDKPSKPTVYGWVHAGTIPVHKGGKKLRFLKSEIDIWLKNN